MMETVPSFEISLSFCRTNGVTYQTIVLLGLVHTKGTDNYIATAISEKRQGGNWFQINGAHTEEIYICSRSHHIKWVCSLDLVHDCNF
jgi:hypothetical protein